MKILVAVPAYTTPDLKQKEYFFQARNNYYYKKGIDVTVLNFKCNNDYVMDGIQVICLNTYNKKPEKYDILVCHQPNLKNHYIFIKKYRKQFNKIVFFFHGHEVLFVNKVYPKPYNYDKSVKKYKTILQNIYDIIKLKIWHNYFLKNKKNSYFVFVSQWMKDQFIKWVKINENQIKDNSEILYNCVGETFENNVYNNLTEKKYDFITIRANLDGSKYCIDLVNRIASNNPDYSFCLIGKGDFFKYNKKPNNLYWINNTMKHEEMISYLNSSKCGLMPTRTDAQGLMMCEMATFGIPVITSDIDVCKEALGDFNNTFFIDNNNVENIDLKKILSSIKPVCENQKYFNKNTSGKEIELFKKILGANNAKY